MSSPPPLKTWYFYNSSAQIDDPLFSIPTSGGPTTAAAALTSEALASLGVSSSSNSAATAVAAVASKTKGDSGNTMVAAAAAATKVALTVGKGPGSADGENTSSAGSFLENTPSSFGTISRSNSVSDFELSDNGIASLEATPVFTPVMGTSSSMYMPMRSTRRPSSLYSFEANIDDIPEVTLDEKSSSYGSNMDYYKPITKNRQPKIEPVEETDQKRDNDKRLNKNASNKQKVNMASVCGTDSQDLKETAAPSERPFFASVTFSGAIAPAANEWTAFNPNDNLRLEEAYENLHLKLKNEKERLKLINHAKHKSRQNSRHSERHRKHRSRYMEGPKCDIDEDELEVLVGIRRIYKVNVQELLIKPAYWIPVKDVSTVVRCSWFFSSSLTPVEPSLEEAVKKAFLRVKPWTEKYIEHLKAALEDPSTFDMIKIPITYNLTPEKNELPPVECKAALVFAPCVPHENHPEFRSNVNLVGSGNSPSFTNSSEEEHSQNADSEDNSILETARKPYPIAYIFPATLGNSSRNPLSYFTSTTVYQLSSCLLSGRVPTGTLTVLQQHFDFEEYKKLRALPDRPSDTIGFTPPKITDLIFVIHGIGQKLSERVESFSFTFAINRFNILITEQLNSPAVKQYLEQDTTILALPINWRRTLDFEEIKSSSHDQDTGKVLFNLAQITMKSIPTIRNIVSDVILDLPYYMSNYKGILMESTVNEANRIYKLFVKNNPGFDDYGRVHVIGHSLGSVLALDILSTQPTDIGAAREEAKRELESKKKRRNESAKGKKDAENTDKEVDELLSKHFCFNTSNLFFAGSPAGFFLLLENSSLIPRKLYEQELYEARMKRYLKSKSTMEQHHEKLILDEPSHDYPKKRNIGAANSKKPSTGPPNKSHISAHLSQPSNYYPYGCMSIDRIYNILHYSDPIGFCLNATVDPTYSETVDPAVLPNEKAFPIIVKPSPNKKNSSFSRSFGSSSSNSSNSDIKEDDTPPDQKSGRFFNGWKVKIPDIFSSNHSTSTMDKTLKETVSMPASPVQEKESEKGDDQETILGVNIDENTGFSPSSSMILEHESASEDEENDDKEEEIIWSSRYFMKKILGSTRRQRSGSQSSFSSVASVNSTFSIQTSISATVKPNYPEFSTPSSELFPHPLQTESSNCTSSHNKSHQSLKALARTSALPTKSGLLEPAFEQRASSLPPDITRTRREKEPRKKSHLAQLFTPSPSSKEKIYKKPKDFGFLKEEFDGNRFTSSEDENDDDQDEDSDEDPFAGMSYAEKKMHLLNDNGQIDYIIPLVGALENQYLAMIKAHATYWDTKDFARLVALECGRRKTGPKKSFEQYRVVKKNEDKEETES